MSPRLSCAMRSFTIGASSGPPLNVMRPAISPAARVHSRSKASCTRLESGVGEPMTMAERQPSATASSAAWRASCSSESEIE